jgi:hypothetical protein
MSSMTNYCKAYLAEQLRQFPGWKENVPPLTIKHQHDSAVDNTTDPLAQEAEVPYFFLHEDFVVTAGIYRDQAIAFDQVTEKWKEFCRQTLHFQPPSKDTATKEIPASAPVITPSTADQPRA